MTRHCPVVTEKYEPDHRASVRQSKMPGIIVFAAAAALSVAAIFTFANSRAETFEAAQPVAIDVWQLQLQADRLPVLTVSDPV